MNTEKSSHIAKVWKIMKGYNLGIFWNKQEIVLVPKSELNQVVNNITNEIKATVQEAKTETTTETKPTKKANNKKIQKEIQKIQIDSFRFFIKNMTQFNEEILPALLKFLKKETKAKEIEIVLKESQGADSYIKDILVNGKSTDKEDLFVSKMLVKFLKLTTSIKNGYVAKDRQSKKGILPSPYKVEIEVKS